MPGKPHSHAVSKAQQRAAAIAEHNPGAARGAAKKMAESMSKAELSAMASTPRKGLPARKKKG